MAPNIGDAGAGIASRRGRRDGAGQGADLMLLRVRVPLSLGFDSNAGIKQSAFCRLSFKQTKTSPNDSKKKSVINADQKI